MSSVLAVAFLAARRSSPRWRRVQLLYAVRAESSSWGRSASSGLHEVAPAASPKWWAPASSAASATVASTAPSVRHRNAWPYPRRAVTAERALLHAVERWRLPVPGYRAAEYARRHGRKRARAEPDRLSPRSCCAAAVFCRRGLTRVLPDGRRSRCRPCAGWTLTSTRASSSSCSDPPAAGKSTLLNILGGLDVPTSGSVRYGDHDLTVYDDARLTRYRARARRLRVPVLQPDPQPDRSRERGAGDRDRARSHATTEEACVWSGSARGWTTSRPALGVGSSSGWRSRGRSRSARRSCSGDEPTGALDMQTGVLVLEAVQRVNRELGHHDGRHHPQRGHRDMADRVVYLHDGRVGRVRANAFKKPPRELVW